MGRTQEELGAALTSPELSELIAFDNLYGYPDIYTLAALLCSTLEGLWSTKPRPITKSVPYFGAGQPAQTGADMAARMQLLSGRMRMKGNRTSGAPTAQNPDDSSA
jgi:hypothetical protein